MKKTLLTSTLATLMLFSSNIHAEIIGKEITYENDGVTFNGFIAYDADRAGTLPGVLVVHEWWGHNEYARKRARQLAHMGYVGLAVDMYGDGKQAEHPKEAGAFSGAVMKNMDVAKARFDAALDLLRKQQNVDPKKTAAIGYCFGGGVVLNMARMGTDVQGVASFHGSLDAKATAKPGTITTRILVCHGADDQFIPHEKVARFKKEMDTAKATYEFISYEGATHSFTNPGADAAAEKFGIPIAYNEAADKASWKQLKDFLADLFE